MYNILAFYHTPRTRKSIELPNNVKLKKKKKNENNTLKQSPALLVIPNKLFQFCIDIVFAGSLMGEIFNSIDQSIDHS